MLLFTYAAFTQTPTQPENGWVTYASREYGFSISMPKAPTSFDEKNDFKKLQSKTFAVYKDNVVYFVRITSGLKKLIKDSGFEDYKREQMDLVIAQDGAEIASRKAKGIELPQLQRLSKFHFDKANGKIYEVWAVTSNKINPQISSFIDSFKVEDKPTGTDIALNDSIGGDESATNQPENEEKSDVSAQVQKIPIRLVLRPAAKYTEEARKKGIQGTVRIRATFTATGKVKNVEVQQILPYGLTEQAIIAAYKIFFLPGTKNGKPISFTRTIEYNFNLY